MSKADHLKHLDKLEQHLGLQLQLVAQSRDTEVARWERQIKGINQQVHQALRGVREDGLEKLRHHHFAACAKMTLDQSKLRNHRAKVCEATSPGTEPDNTGNAIRFCRNSEFSFLKRCFRRSREADCGGGRQV